MTGAEYIIDDDFLDDETKMSAEAQGYLWELIRCKDCKYYYAEGCDECVLMNANSIIASINNKRWYSDFYCAWGERKEDE